MKYWNPLSLQPIQFPENPEIKKYKVTGGLVNWCTTFMYLKNLRKFTFFDPITSQFQGNNIKQGTTTTKRYQKNGFSVLLYNSERLKII